MTGPGETGRARLRLEVSDLIIAFEDETAERRPVARDEVVARLRAVGDRRAADRVAQMPVDVLGYLLPGPVDELLIRMHTQLQRLWEELRQVDLAAGILRPLLATVRSSTPGAEDRPLRVVDVGCGIGYFVRWASSSGALGPGVEVVGCDIDPVLVAEARRLADAEGLVCRFEIGDAFALPSGADVYVSCGVLHHVEADRLPAFFAGQQEAGGFIHWDPVPSYLSTLGAWLFHRARMREPLARHDGLRSIQRGHTDEVLLAAVAAGAPQMASALHGLPNRRLPVLDVIRPVIGVQPEMAAPFREALGPAARRLVPGRGNW